MGGELESLAPEDKLPQPCGSPGEFTRAESSMANPLAIGVRVGSDRVGKGNERKDLRVIGLRAARRGAQWGGAAVIRVQVRGVGERLHELVDGSRGVLGDTSAAPGGGREGVEAMVQHLLSVVVGVD